MRRIALLFAFTLTAHAQWQILDSHSTASFRGVDALKNGVVWVSGTEGTVLRSIDDGKTWTRCSTPPGAEKLDFRGVQGFDEKTAVVMSSGKGDLSRIYKTQDGCINWVLVLTNSKSEGFYDAVVADGGGAIVVGDPVNGRFDLMQTTNSGHRIWTSVESSKKATSKLSSAKPGESLFAASNSNLISSGSDTFLFVTGGTAGAYLHYTRWHVGIWEYRARSFEQVHLPLAVGDSAGAFSIAYSRGCNPNKKECGYVIVGGDYKKTDAIEGVAAYTRGYGNPGRVYAAQQPPHGYRSAVAYQREGQVWITVGPNGTDISTDDGKNWKPLTPSKDDAPGADKNWNALSLPFVVGPKGRIGKLRPDALSVK